MIGWICGNLMEWDGLTALVDVGGVGYEVTVPDQVAVVLGPPGSPVQLRVRQIVREDAVTLYGFIDSGQRRLFDILTGVSGCGPKVALSLIGGLGDEEVLRALKMKDIQSLRRASGVGPKLAERLVVELKDKVLEESFTRKLSSASAAAAVASTDELVDALIGLGYKRTEAESAAQSAREEANDERDQLKLALRILRA